jgi:hypothetical protein
MKTDKDDKTWQPIELVMFAWIAFLYAVLAAPVYGLVLRPEKAPEWVQALGSILTIVAGFSFVLIQNRLDQKAHAARIRHQEQITLHLLAFQLRTISREVEWIEERLAAVAHEPLRHFLIEGFEARTAALLPLSELGFLLNSGEHGLMALQRIYSLQSQYESWKFNLKLRQDTYINEEQPPIKAKHIQTGKHPTPAEKQTIAGEVLDQMLRNATNRVYDSTRALIDLLNSQGPQLEAELRALYPHSTLLASWRDKNKFVP